MQFKYEELCTPSPKIEKLDHPPETPTNRLPLRKRLESDKEEHSWTDDESTPTNEAYHPTSHRYNHRIHHHSDHRASIVSAPPCTMRSGSISAMSGVST